MYVFALDATDDHLQLAADLVALRRPDATRPQRLKLWLDEIVALAPTFFDQPAAEAVIDGDTVAVVFRLHDGTAVQALLDRHGHPWRRSHHPDDYPPPRPNIAPL